MTVRVASKGDTPIASILTLSFKRQVYYKYGCSDERFHNLGGIQMLIWRAILTEKSRGATVLDMGRSNTDQESLLIFKQRWGSTRLALGHYRYPPTPQIQTTHKWAERLASYALSQMPDSLLATAGKLLYPHIG